MKKIFVPAALLCALLSQAQISFTNQTSLLPASTYYSGTALGVFDADGDGKDDIVRSPFGSTMNINYQQAPNAAFTQQSFSNGSSNNWGMCAGDVNNDGKTDVLWCSDSYALLSTANASATSYSVSNISTITSAPFLFPQGCNISDVNNDGKADLFVCNDIAKSHIYKNMGSGNWQLDTNLIPLNTFPASDNSGNYASIFTDINNDGYMDFYLTRCRQGVTNPADPRRINQVFLNNGNFTYTQDVSNTSNLRFGAQSWSTAFGDINNDGAMDAFVLNYDVESNLMLNNGSGVFSDITSSAGVTGSTSYFGINTSFHDFDNDGFVDLLIGGFDFTSSGVGHRLYHNNGNNTFTQITAFGTASMSAYGVGDLNHDGFPDVYASYANDLATPSSTDSDVLWMNSGNSNHWIVFSLTGIQSNKNGIGSIIKIYGPWGVQVREIRGGEGYGIQNSLMAHFGLGNQQTVDSVVVQWPSGTVDVLTHLASNTFFNIPEGNYPLALHSQEKPKPLAAVFPNPAHDDITLRIENFSAMGTGKLSLRVTDMNGREVYAEQALQRSIIPLGRLSGAGMYFYTISCEGEVRGSGKFIVE